MVENRRTALLSKAAAVVCGQRENNYGAPEDNFRRIARLWNAHLENTARPVLLRPEDIPLMMALFKIARLEHSPSHEDSIVDLIGYAACYGEIVAEEIGAD